MSIIKMSAQLVSRMGLALGNTQAGKEVSGLLNGSGALMAQTAQSMPALIIATGTSTTVDFGSLVVGDRIIHIPASAGNSVSLLCATAGTLPISAVNGDTYLVYRTFTRPADPQGSSAS